MKGSSSIEGNIVEPNYKPLIVLGRRYKLTIF
jgi:hypothetical protein